MVDATGIKTYYENGLWSIDKVYNVVAKEAITEAEYLEITGFTYPATSKDTTETTTE
jgi:hypothetical protein